MKIEGGRGGGCFSVCVCVINCILDGCFPAQWSVCILSAIECLINYKHASVAEAVKQETLRETEPSLTFDPHTEHYVSLLYVAALLFQRAP